MHATLTVFGLMIHAVQRDVNSQLPLEAAFTVPNEREFPRFLKVKPVTPVKLWIGRRNAAGKDIVSALLSLQKIAQEDCCEQSLTTWVIQRPW